MAQVDLPKISYFRCHVGHQFGPQALAAAQLEASERKLWSAVAALEEQAAVLTSQPAVASSSGGLLDQALTWSRNAAARLATYALAPDDGTCSTTRIVAARLDSSAPTKAIKLSTPPAEAPTTTMSRQPSASRVSRDRGIARIWEHGPSLPPGLDSGVGDRPSGGISSESGRCRLHTRSTPTCQRRWSLSQPPTLTSRLWREAYVREIRGRSQSSLRICSTRNVR